MRIAAVCDELAISIEDAATLATELDLSGIVLRMSGSQRFPDFTENEAKFISSRPPGLTLLGASPGLWKDPWNDSRDPGAWQLDAQQAREAARLHSIPSLSFFTWKPPKQEHHQEPETLSPQMPAGILNTFKTVARENAAAGSITLIENNYAMWAGTGRTAAQLVEHIDEPSVALIWDPASSAATHFDAGANPATLTQTLLDEWNSIEPLVSEIHVRGMNVTSGQRTWCVPGEGILDWSQILQRVHAKDPSLLLTIEHHQFDQRKAASTASVTFIRHVLSGESYQAIDTA